MKTDDLRFDAEGLIPAVVQEVDSGDVLMVAWMNADALKATLASGLTHFWSRSRRTLWRKGETSGHAQHVSGIYVDCDADTLLVQVHQDGVACHTGERTCFFRTLREPSGDTDPAALPPPANMLARLDDVVASRKLAAPAGSYVGGLLAKGEPAVCRKIGEEAAEVMTAALGGEGDARLVEEIADLWFHTIVLLGLRGIRLREVLRELGRRHERRSRPAAE